MFSIELNWEDGSGIKGAELSATWCAMSIAVNQLLITDVLRSRSKSVDDKIYVPAYVLAEWFAMNWFSILEELETPRREVNNEYIKRHGLLFSRNGYEFPNLYIHRTGDGIKIGCRKIQSSSYGLRYLSEGSEIISGRSFEDTVYSFINTVVARLENLGVSETLLQEEWSYISGMHPEEAMFCRAAGAIGQNPFEMDAEDADRLSDLYSGRQDPLIRELSGISNSVSELEELILRVEAITSSKDFEFRFDLSGLAYEERHNGASDQVARNDLSSWTLGYDAAHNLRKEIGIDSTFVFGSVSKFIEVLSGEQNATRVPMDSFRELSGLIRTRGDGTGILDVAVRKSREQSILFELGRAVGLHLVSPASQVIPITSSPSYVQQTSRAFAAEFLAPAATIRKRIQSAEYMEDSDWDELAEGFGVSPWVIHHQVQNHDLYRYT